MHIPNESAGRGHRERNSSKHRQSSAATVTVERSCAWRPGAAGERMLRKTRTTKVFKTKIHSVLALLPPETGKGEGDPQHQALKATEDPALSNNLQLHLQEVAGVSELEEMGKAPSGQPLSTDSVVC